MTNNNDHRFSDGTDINQILVAHIFRNAGLTTNKTPEQDLNCIKAFVMNSFTAEASGQPKPRITDELIKAAQRLRIIADSKGEEFPLFYGLEEAVTAREEPLAQYIEEHTDVQYARFLDKLAEPKLF